MINQLVAEAEGLPDQDEFEGLSITDIAHAITLWPEGSEDQLRAIAAIRRRAPGIGHNRPPLAESLDEELAPLRGRQEQLLAVARAAVIVDDDSAKKVIDLVAQLRAFETEIDDARKKRAAPYVSAHRLINDSFGALLNAVALARQGADGRGGLRATLTAYEDKREAEAEAERRRAREEQRRREEDAAAARRKAEEAAAAGQGSVAAHMEALKAEDEAERAARRAEAIRPEPIRSHLGQASRRREIRFEVEDIRKALGWLLKHEGLVNNLRQAVNTMLGTHLRSIGIAAVEAGVSIPGVRAWVDKGAVNVRR